MKINLDLKEKSYDIYVERGILKKASDYINLNRRVLIVTDDGVPADYAACLEKQCKSAVKAVLPQGEATKNLKSFEKLCRIMLENNFSRKDCVVALGGGVMGDLAGFAAACYMRGIDFYNIPTTLLSQVDSSIGGKVAVDFDGVKNIVGAFYQPKMVLIDPDTLYTLSDRQFYNGLAEAVKMSMTHDKELFELIEKSNDIKKDIDTVIVKSLLIKKSVVEHDEKESGERKALNFGHTIGHAVETVNMGKLLHGECVALGMLPMCSEDIKPRLEKVLKQNNLPTAIQDDADKLLKVMKHDKKADGDSVDAVFVEKIGKFKLKKVKTDDLKNLL